MCLQKVINETNCKFLVLLVSWKSRTKRAGSVNQVSGSKDTDADPYHNVMDQDLQCCESRLVSFWKPDPNTYQSQKRNPELHQSKKLDPDPDPHPHQSQKQDPDPTDPHQIKHSDPDPHFRDADPQATLEPYTTFHS